VFCIHCGSPNPDGSSFCSQCGVAIPAPNPAATQGVSQPAQGTHHKHLLSELGERITKFTDTSPLEGFSLGEMFSEVFKSRSPEEVEDYLVVGTTHTTPPLANVATGWPKPWFFVRVLIFVVVVYVLFLISMPYFGNPRFIPGFIFLGSLAVPLATLVLFFELNTPRNVSFYSLLMLICFGGILSLIATSIVGKFSFLDWMGPPSAGIVEEFAKLATVVIVCRQAKHKYILNGMLFGAAIGTGFAVFESAGYAQDALIGGLVQTKGWANFFAQGGASFLNSAIFSRAWLSPFGHVVWTAIAAGALWRVKKEGVFELRMLDKTFWKTFLVPVACHMTWDSRLAMGTQGPPEIWNYAITLGLGAISWFVAFGLVQEGLKQVRAMQAQAAAPPQSVATTA
jgi:RsiW-degrading membrane proteinase PrsW (M82 family)